METFSTAQAANILNIGQPMVQLWVKQGLFPGAFRDEKTSYWRIPAEDLESIRKERELPGIKRSAAV
jgi:predicted site-specific integrase-resolvase